MNGKVLAIIAVLLIIVGGGAFLLLRNTTSTNSTSDATLQQTDQAVTPTSTDALPTGSSPSGDMEEGAVKEITVEGSNFKFVPSQIRVKEGDTVRITFKNTGGFHDFVIDEFNVTTKQTQGPSEEVIEFVASKKGEYEYYCSVGSHRQMGMVGTLIVE